MPFAFTLPTTSNISYLAHFSSSTHPSLPLTATTHRAVLHDVLKRYKRLPMKSKSPALSAVLSALDDYIPYLWALDAGLSGKLICGEELDTTLLKEIEIQWRSSLSSTIPGREAPRPKGKGLDFEICFVLNTLALAYTLYARVQLHGLHGTITPTAEQKTTIITTATKHMLHASSIHSCLAARCAETDASSAVIETLSQTQSALAAIALAEATLLAVLKDDPYPAVVAQDRNKNDKDWMIKPPEIPKVRAHLFARLCLAAAEHAGKAEALLSASSRVDEALIHYTRNLRGASRAKACRFFGIDAELGGETGRGIAWLISGKKQLGFGVSNEESSKLKGLAKFKKGWTERREDKKIEKERDWGSDAGRFEESRVIEMLEQKWNKMNDTINTQVIPPSDPLAASMPSGRNIHSTKPYIPPSLDEETLAQMRAPSEIDNTSTLAGDDSSDDERGQESGAPPGAFPGSFGFSSSDNSYY